MKSQPSERQPESYWIQVAAVAAAMCLMLGLRATPQLPGRVLVTEWRLGGPEGRGATAFVSEPSVVVDRQGAIYTRGQGDSRISVFDSAGRFLRTIGRRGQGPGEFVEASGHGLVGDTLWVSNWPNGAIATFGTNGHHLITRRVIVPLAERFAAPLGISGLLADGHAIVIPDGAPVGSGGRRTVPVLIGDREMRSADTLFRIVRPVSLVVPGVGTFRYAPVAIPPLIDIASDGSGILVVDWERNADEVTVRRLASDGRAEWAHKLAVPSSRIDSRARDSIIDRAVEMAAGQIEASRRRGTVAPGVRTRSLVERSLDLPDRYPPVTGAVLGVDGTVWLHRGEPGTLQRWLVLDSAGAPIFEVTSALPLTVQEASRQVVWGTFSDGDGFPYLARYRVGAPKQE